MIKDFETYINEDYFSKLASRKDNGIERRENTLTEEDVKKYIIPGQLSCCKSINIRYEKGKPIVDIDGDFTIEDVEEIPFKFGRVTGDFDCSYIKLKSLKNCPDYVGGTFDCSYTHITSLEGCPQEVGTFECSDTDITSLEGCPQIINKSFKCVTCTKLTSLKGCPQKIPGDFRINGCTLIKNLEYGPQRVGRKYACRNCGLTSLKGCPREIGGSFSISFDGDIADFEYFPKRVMDNVIIKLGVKNYTEEEMINIILNKSHIGNIIKFT